MDGTRCPFDIPEEGTEYTLNLATVPPSCCFGLPTGGTICFSMTPDVEVIDPTEQVVIDVFVDPASDVGAYQLALDVTGGDTGSLDVSAMVIDQGRGDFIFTGNSVFDGAQVSTGLLGAGMLDGTGVDVTSTNDYLGTFTLTASADASGVFEVKLRGIAEAFLDDSNAVRLGTSPGESVLIGVDVECVNDQACDDSSECTDDACVAYVCQNTNNFCDDADDCTTDTCNAGVCTHGSAPPGTSCEDGLFCTEPDTCNNKGNCIGGPNDPCNEGEVCSEPIDTCLPGS